MRALCGSIIAAGALIGLGLLNLGIGVRYAAFPGRDPEGNVQWVKFSQIDTPLMFSMVFLVIAAAVGLGIAFIGLAYHHERRLHERTRDLASRDAGQRVTLSH
jgi:hypothetical protein